MSDLTATRFRRFAISGLAVSALIVAAACSQTRNPSPTAPAAGSAESSFALGPTGSTTPAVGQVRICKAGNTSGTFAVSKTAVSGGVATILAAPTIANGSCYVVAEDFDTVIGVGSNITVTENPATNLTGITAQRIDNGNITSFTFTNGSQLFLNNFHGYTLTFTNTLPVVTGDEGCTPGYWKQPQHADSWQVYSPGADFDATFGVNFFNPNLTLLAALENGGGGVDALGRHAVAALLNAVSTNVNYKYTVAQVIAIVRGTGAYAGLSVEERKDLLAAANEATCPIN